MEQEKKSNGALVGSIIIIVILLVGGIYIWQSKVKNALEQKKVQTQEVTPADSSELNTLDQDLNATDTNVDVNVDKIQ